MNEQIFREYDIRGIAERDLDEQTVELIGRAYGTRLINAGAKSVAVARDVRLSSPRIAEGLSAALVGSGLEVIDIGCVPTPFLYFAIRHLQTGGGVMVTGSHNPPEFNGFKLCVGTEALHGEGIQELRTIAESGDFKQGTGNRTEVDIIGPYGRRIREEFQFSRKIPIVVDSGNGTAGAVAPPLFRELGCEVTELFSEPDGRFPNHMADPTVPENLEELIRTVKKTGAACGLAYDGDADRIGVVDESGNILWGDRLMILFARKILESNPGATIIGEVKCSQLLYDDIRSRGGKAIMWRTGHSLIKKKMKDVNAALAGEMSGHIFFADRYYGYDDALYASCRVLEIIDRSDKPLSALLADLPETYSTPEIRVDCPDDRKFDVVEKVKKLLSAENEVIDIDGARVLFPDGWGLVRASNTQPVLVLRFEAQSSERLEEIRGYVESRVKEARESVT